MPTYYTALLPNNKGIVALCFQDVKLYINILRFTYIKITWFTKKDAAGSSFRILTKARGTNVPKTQPEKQQRLGS